MCRQRLQLQDEISREGGSKAYLVQIVCDADHVLIRYFWYIAECAVETTWKKSVAHMGHIFSLRKDLCHSIGSRSGIASLVSLEVLKNELDHSGARINVEPLSTLRTGTLAVIQSLDGLSLAAMIPCSVSQLLDVSGGKVLAIAWMGWIRGFQNMSFDVGLVVLSPISLQSGGTFYSAVKSDEAEGQSCKSKPGGMRDFMYLYLQRITVKARRVKLP
ncbi:hypothetical protein KCU78_g23, partial [Aureobasidium melanogenum]